MAKNANLHAARQNKNDEFYTRLEDIEAELRHYKNHFAGKTVLCNCDDPYESNFFKFFALRFNSWKLKKLICTCYKGSSIAGTQLSLFGDEIEIESECGVPNAIHPPRDERARTPYKAVMTALYDTDGNQAIQMEDVWQSLVDGDPRNTITPLAGDGSFDSPECVKLLEEADIVVTNPPFSRFRDFVGLLEEKQKKYLIIGNVNAITYKEIFPLIKSDRLWMGPSIHSGDRAFYVPDYYPLDAAGCGIDEKTKRPYIKVKGVRWFTNLDHPRRHEELVLFREYHADPSKYPHYDNYDAIEVGKVVDIPVDYEGVMGVPITFLDKYCPEQFEIIGATANGQVGEEYKLPWPRPHNNPFIGGKAKYQRILVRNKNPHPAIYGEAA